MVCRLRQSWVSQPNSEECGGGGADIIGFDSLAGDANDGYDEGITAVASEQELEPEQEANGTPTGASQL
jgi:hypothetical protein